MAGAVNGSLWSLGPEFWAYGLVALVGSCGVRSRRDGAAAVLLGLMVALLAYYAWGHEGQTKAHFEVLALFGWGAWWVQWRTLRQRSEPIAVGSGLLVLLAAGVYVLWIDGGWRRLVLLAVVAGLVSLGHRVSWGKAVMDRLGDVSYGMYIYAFPVQQTLVHFFPQWPLGLHLGLASVLTMTLAWVSWHGVERLALRLKPTRPA